MENDSDEFPCGRFSGTTGQSQSYESFKKMIENLEIKQKTHV
jgi:hypothetical protein